MEPDYNEPDDLNRVPDTDSDPCREWRARMELRRGYRKYVGHLCSCLGFSLCLLYLLMGLSGFVMILMYDAISVLLPSEDYMPPVINMLSYAVALPAMLLFLRKVPEVQIEPKKMRFRKFIMFLALTMGGGYIFNVISVFINSLISASSGRTMEQLNPVADVLTGFNWIMAFYMVLFAPILEEFIFRKVLLNRLRPLGEKGAILYSAVMFGFLHGNIAQFLYATAIGIILGYVAVKTGRIFHTVILHMIVNGYSVFVVTGVVNALDSQIQLRDMALGVISLVYIGLAVAALVIYLVKRKKTFLRSGNAPEGVGYADFSSAMYGNPGSVVFLLISAYSMIIVAFFG